MAIVQRNLGRRGLLGALLGGRRLGVTSALVNGGLIYGSAVSSTRAPVRPIGPARPISITSNGGVIQNPIQVTGPYGGKNGSQYGGGYQSGTEYGSGYQNPNLPTSSNNLAQLTLQYQSNPASLTPQQWQQLQAAGVIPSTIPYSDASLVNPSASTATASSSAIDPATGIPYATELAEAEAGTTTTATTAASALTTQYGGLPLYVWLLIGGGAILLFKKK